MLLDYDEEARIITISLLDFYYKNVAGQLLEINRELQQINSLQSPLRSLFSYSRSVLATIDNLIRSKGRDLHSILNDLVVVDSILALL